MEGERLSCRQILKIIRQDDLKSKEIAEELDFKDSGYRPAIKVGRGAGQAIFHLHIHLIGDGTKVKYVSFS